MSRQSMAHLLAQTSPATQPATRPAETTLPEAAASFEDLRRQTVGRLPDLLLWAIQKRLQSNGIDLPFPTHQVLLHDQTEETDGDRPRQREGWPAGKGDVPPPRWLASGNGAADATTGGGDGNSPGAAR